MESLLIKLASDISTIGLDTKIIFETLFVYYDKNDINTIVYTISISSDDVLLIDIVLDNMRNISYETIIQVISSLNDIIFSYDTSIQFTIGFKQGEQN